VSRDFPRLLAAIFVVAQVADALTALVVSRELNPIIGSAPPGVAIALKVLLIVFVLAVVEISSRKRPTLARVVLLVGIVAGFAGALSNTDLTPFRGYG
jgi:uncharacterized oligopeptide transporter (OPT) family protein